MIYEKIKDIVFDAYQQYAIPEMLWLSNIVEKIKPKNILEIGMGFGASLMVWEYLLEPGGLLVGIENDKRMFEALKWLIKRSTKDIRLILKDSEDPESIRKVAEYFPNRSLDFLYIDGGHSYEQARSDYIYYSPLVRTGGIVALHDIRHSECGISLFWKGLKGEVDLKIEEFDDHNGVGVIHVR